MKWLTLSALLVVFLLVAGGYVAFQKYYAIAHIPVFESSFESKARIMDCFRLDKIEKCGWSLSGSHKSHGETGLCVVVDKGYKADDDVERSEFQDPIKIPLDKEVWYRLDFMIPEDFPEVDNRLVLWQLKQEGGNNPLLSMRYRDGKLSIKQRFDSNKIVYYQPDEMGRVKGRWMRVVIHARASSSGSGFYDVYLNDRRIIQYTGQTAYEELPGATYFKFGLYRDAVDIPMHMYFDQYFRGPSWRDVVFEKRTPPLRKRLWRSKVKQLAKR